MFLLLTRSLRIWVLVDYKLSMEDSKMRRWYKFVKWDFLEDGKIQQSILKKVISISTNKLYCLHILLYHNFFFIYLSNQISQKIIKLKKNLITSKSLLNKLRFSRLVKFAIASGNSKKKKKNCKIEFPTSRLVANVSSASSFRNWLLYITSLHNIHNNQYAFLS